MHTDDAVELARNIKTLSYHEWQDVTDDLVFVCCGECGAGYEVMLRSTGPDMYRIRICFDDALTQANRETDGLPLTLYRELLALREQNAQYAHRIADLESELCNIQTGQTDGT